MLRSSELLGAVGRFEGGPPRRHAPRSEGDPVPGDIERLTVAEAAKRLGVSTSTIRRRIRLGELQAAIEQHPQGKRIFVFMPMAGPPREAASDGSSVAVHATSEVESELRAHIETLRHALAAEQRAGAELRELLGLEKLATGEARRRLEEVREQLLLAESVTCATDAATDPQPGVMDKRSPPAESEAAADTPRPPRGLLIRALRAVLGFPNDPPALPRG